MPPGFGVVGYGDHIVASDVLDALLWIKAEGLKVELRTVPVLPFRLDIEGYLVQWPEVVGVEVGLGLRFEPGDLVVGGLELSLCGHEVCMPLDGADSRENKAEYPENPDYSHTDTSIVADGAA